MQLLAARVLAPGRSDASPANADDGKLACGRTYAIEYLFSEPGSGHPPIARIHLNGAATHP
jgi:hypothetical protein